MLASALTLRQSKNHSEVHRSLFVIQPVNLRNPYFISGDAVPTGMGGRGISLVRGGGSTPTTGRGWMSTGATGLDWTTGGDCTSSGCGAASIPGAIQGLGPPARGPWLHFDRAAPNNQITVLMRRR